ncbi:MAG: rRNA maturation RNase YbeY [Anaerolineales bacterium]|nr:rRNA maturation RNase YbeY [Anaerolineales bacterium]
MKARYTIEVLADARQARRVKVKAIRRAAHAALAHQQATPGALTIRLTGDATLRRLNRKFMGHDVATDVLSFPAEEPGYFGDLAISVTRAAAQAKASGHSLQAELELLVVHGVLHLLGHDHETQAQQARMWAAQAAVLSNLGSEITGPEMHTVRGHGVRQKSTNDSTKKRFSPSSNGQKLKN